MGWLFGNERGKKNVQVPDAATETKEMRTFEEELTELINKYSLETLSNTPDFILCFYLKDCLVAFNNAQQRRKEWFSAREEEKKGRASQMSPL